LGWEEVQVEDRDVQEGEEELLLIHFNKQRIKSFKELINEYLILDRYYREDLRNIIYFLPKFRDYISYTIN